MLKKILALISIFSLMLCCLVACGKKGKISIQVETEMKVGETYKAKYELKNIDESVKLTWKVSDTGMAELDCENLTIKALKEGTFTLTVTAKTGEVASKEIKIVKSDVSSIEYAITYELDGGRLFDGPTKYNGTEEIVLPTPTKEGYEFKGWYATSEFLGNYIEKITIGESGNKCFYAKWEKNETIVKYTITFEFNGGHADNIPNKYDGTEEVVLPTPIFAGYIFKGWFETNEFTDAAVEKITIGTTGDKMYYAKWEVIEYTISYEVNGGQMESATTKYNVESPTVVLPTPTKEGYKFKGWFENDAFTGLAVEKVAAGSTGDKIYYAKWEKEENGDPILPDGVYSITYETNGGTLLNAPTQYDGKSDVYLFTPLRDGYYFIGWFASEDFSGSIVDKIEAGSTGNIKLYAKWTIDNSSK